MEAKKSKLPIVIISIVLSLFVLTGVAYRIFEIWFLNDFRRFTSQLPKFEQKEVGDFVVRFYDGYCEIYGTTEQGNSKEFLVIPEYIDGVRVDAFGYRSLIGALDLGSYDSLCPPVIENNNYEKIYFEKPIHFYPSIFRVFNCKKILYLGAVPNDHCRRGLNKLYFPRHIYEQENDMSNKEQPANVSFYYNYENADNSDYYWIDDCDYGNKIEYVPKAPEREGYTFGGWYKEPECINEWNFDTDTLPEEKTEQKESYRYNEETQEREVYYKEVTVYQETILYAKWL